jgi:tetratricopeptide (TPR) repeat protein
VNRWSDDPEGALAEARRMADKAIEVAPQALSGHVVATIAAALARDFMRADRETGIAESISPNHPAVFGIRADQKMRRADPQSAIGYYERAMRLDPHATNHHLQMLGMAYLHLERFETAAALFRRRIVLVPETDMSRSYLVSCLGHLARIDEARAVHAELMVVNPKYDLAAHLSRMPMGNDIFSAIVRAGWNKAGLGND